MAFATENYDVNFPLFSKIEVNGDGACELYQMLKAAHADEKGNPDIGWNFTKFLVDGSGSVIARYGPIAAPEDIRADVEALL